MIIIGNELAKRKAIWTEAQARQLLQPRDLRDAGQFERSVLPGAAKELHRARPGAEDLHHGIRGGIRCSSLSPRKSTLSTRWQSRLSAKTTSSTADTKSSLNSTSTPSSTTLSTTSPTFPVRFADPGKHTGIFTSYSCPNLIQSRISAFNLMLDQLSAICSKLPDTVYLEWLQLDHQLIVPL